MVLSRGKKDDRSRNLVPRVLVALSRGTGLVADQNFRIAASGIEIAARARGTAWAEVVGLSILKARLLSMNHLMSRVLQSSTNHKTCAQVILTYCSSNLIELSVKFVFLSLRFWQRCFQNKSSIRAHKSPSPLSIIFELATGILAPFC